MYTRPRITSAAPIGVISNIPRPRAPWRSSMLLASRKAGALITVSVVPRDAARDMGISTLEGGMPLSRARRMRIGSIIAVTMR